MVDPVVEDLIVELLEWIIARSGLPLQRICDHCLLPDGQFRTGWFL